MHSCINYKHLNTNKDRYPNTIKQKKVINNNNQEYI